MQLSNQFKIESVYVQPGTKCNLNCNYCYITESSRKSFNFMSPSLLARLGESIRSEDPIFGSNVEIVFHGGEPLLFGKERFGQLIAPIEDLAEQRKIHFKLQSNATLIDDEWCDFFNNHHFPLVGVSIDGPSSHNSNRVDWKGQQTFSRALQGIQSLKRNGVNFSTISVVSRETLSALGPQRAARELYEFLIEIDPLQAGVNVEDVTGVNTQRSHLEDDFVKCFWEALAYEWRKNPVVRIREIDIPLSWLQFVGQSGDVQTSQYDMRIELLPTIGWSGEVCLFSPELLTIEREEASQFIVGSLGSTAFMDIINAAPNKKYFQDFMKSVELCKAECPLFAICRGGKPSYRYFEQGKIADIMHTNHCKSQVIAPTEALMECF